MLTPLFVATRIVANPVSNAFQKQLTRKSANPLFIILATHALLTPVCLPFVFSPAAPALGWGFWANMMTCAILAVGGNVLLVYALKSADLSVLGPVNAYKSIISLILAIFLVGELPTLAGLCGVLLIVAGSYFLVDRKEGEAHRKALLTFFRDRGIQFRFAALALSETEAVFLKRAILHSTPTTTFVYWSILGLPIALVAVFFLMSDAVRQEVGVFAKNTATYLWLAATTGTMQLATLLTFGKLQVGYSLALFQLSTLISVFLGYRYFQERNIRKRLFGTAIMVAGAVLIVVFGTDP